MRDKTAPITILFFGDIVGRVGRKGLAKIIPELKREYRPDLIIANGENMAHGQKITEKTLTSVLESGVDVVTSGDHHRTEEEIRNLTRSFPTSFLRPANLPPRVPGKGIIKKRVRSHTVIIVNLLGRVFMRLNPDCPFRTLDRILAEHKEHAIVFVDFHAEATSEKVALGWHADGRISAIIGTHTHVPTADARILPRGTGYCTDAGMTGARDSVIGTEKDIILFNFLTQLSEPHDIPTKGVAQINAVLVAVNPKTGSCTAIQRVDREVEI